MSKILRLVLGDQLNPDHSWFKKKDPDVLYTLMEIRPEASYALHHIQKIIGFFAAMRAFADTLSAQGHSVVYYEFDDPQNQHSFEKNLLSLIQKYAITRFEYQEPDEYRLDVLFKDLCRQISIPSAMVSSEHFYTARFELKEFFSAGKKPIMENFYRAMRKKHNIMMEGKNPLGGKWNYDKENRRSLDKNIEEISFLKFEHDVSSLHKMIENQGISSIGQCDARHFNWPLTQDQSLKLLDDFLVNHLAFFGTYQDAMDTKFPYLFHSRLSFSLNTKQITPLQVVERALAYWQKNRQEISIAQIEGFIRQIIGWREFMRGIYWAYMPDYQTMNYFGHNAQLPSFYWTGETRMNCLKHAIDQSLQLAYAHHIQRLMITGNFALLSACHPNEVDQWYLGIYMDAVQWVEITNTRGMSQYADGGIIGTKPYVSSANYIHKMSNYCNECYYDRNKRYGDRACPFNSLYWDFFMRHEELLAKNMRTAMVYNLLKKMDKKEKSNIRKQADAYLSIRDEL